MTDSIRTRTLNRRQMVEAVRDACARAAAQAYEEAGMSGLCAEGRWESAIEAIRHLNLDAVVRQPAPPSQDVSATDADRRA